MVPIQNIRLVRGSSKIWWLQTVSSLVLIAIISIGNNQIPKKEGNWKHPATNNLLSLGTWLFLKNCNRAVPSFASPVSFHYFPLFNCHSTKKKIGKNTTNVKFRQFQLEQKKSLNSRGQFQIRKFWNMNKKRTNRFSRPEAKQTSSHEQLTPQLFF